LGLKATPRTHVVWKFQRKKIKAPFVMNCPKSLCCQKTHFGPLGVNWRQGSCHNPHKAKAFTLEGPSVQI